MTNSIFGKSMRFDEVIEIVRQGKESNIHYDVYSEIENIDELKTESHCLIDKPIEVTDDGEEIYPYVAQERGLSFLISDENLRSIVFNACHQKSSISNPEIVDGVIYYSEHDNFMKYS